MFFGKGERDFNIGAVLEVELKKWFSIQVGIELNLHLEAEIRGCATLYKDIWKKEGNIELRFNGALRMKYYGGPLTFAHDISDFGTRVIPLA